MPIPTSFPCNRCNKVFNRKDKLLRHLKEVHLGIKRGAAQTQPSSHDQSSPSSGAHLDPSPSESSLANTHGCFSDRAIPEVAIMNSASSIQGPEAAVENGTGELDVASDTPQEAGIHESDQRSICAMADVCMKSQAVDNRTTKGQLTGASPENAVDMDNASMRSNYTSRSVKSSFGPSKGTIHSTIMRKGASPRLRDFKLPVRCVLCQGHLGSNMSEIRAHLDEHLKAFNTGFRCDICEIDFERERDLKLHQQSADLGHCGFGFEHIQPCHENDPPGHHPPDAFSEMLTDNDRIRFYSRLWHWQHAQVKSYLEQVSNMINGEAIPLEVDCWSIGALRSSIGTVSSLFSNLKLSSAPDASDYQGRLPRRRRVVMKLPWETSKDDEIYQGRVSRLIENVGFGMLSTVRTSIEEGADVNGVCCQKFTTPLCAAARRGHKEIIELLLDGHADINAAGDRDCGTALCCAVTANRYHIVRLLIDRGANVNQAVCQYGTALIASVLQASKDMIQLLLGCGAEVTHDPFHKRFGNALEEAMLRNDVEKLELLLRYAQKETVDSGQPAYGKALEKAITHGKSHLVELFMKYGAVERLDKEHYDKVLGLAVFHNRYELITLLAQRGSVMRASDPPQRAHLDDKTRSHVEHGSWPCCIARENALIRTTGRKFSFEMDM